MALRLSHVLKDFADALKAIDRRRIAHKDFRPGIGPFGEAIAVKEALKQMKEVPLGRYANAITKQFPDLLIPSEWAIEFKIARPFGDNGKPAEHWSENILHPYPGNTSSLGDCMKLLNPNISERKAVVIFGFEHASPRTPLDPAIDAFELLAIHILRLKMSRRCEERRNNLVHPVHQVLRVFGWQVLGPVESSVDPE